MGKLTRMIAVGALAAAMLAGTAPASHADCVSAEVYTEDSSGNKDYIVGPKACIVSTPWPEAGNVSGDTPFVKVGFKVWYTRPTIPPSPE